MRDAYLDHCKAMLIFLVVFGHFLERMIGWKDPIIHTLLGSIYFIHMPAFIFISGMLFKDKNWFKNIIFFLALYLPFQIIFPLFDALWTSQIKINWNLFERPYWILWYLLGMIIWTALTHVLIKTKFAVFISLLLALLIGLSPWNNYQYSIGRIFTFFPFFILGVVYGKTIIQKVQQCKYAGLFALGIFSAIISLVYLTQINPYWLYGSLSYQQLKESSLEGTWIRLGCFIMSCLGSLALFVLSKHVRILGEKLGQNTLSVYLLHAFVVMFIARYWQFNLNIYAELLICFALSIMTCWVLQQRLFDRMLREMSFWMLKPVAVIEKLIEKIKV